MKQNTQSTILCIAVILNFFFVLSLDASISMHKKDVISLNSFVEDAPEKLDGLKELTGEIEERVQEIRELLKDTQETKPIKTVKKDDVTFNYYKDNIIIYTTPKGKGIKLGKKEKLFFKEKGVSYTLTDTYYYSEYLVIDKKTKELVKLKWLSVGNYEYWENANSQYGFKKKNSEDKLVYKIYTVVSDSGTLYKITLQNKAGIYFARKSAKEIRYYTFVPDRGIKTKAESTILYYISNNKKIGYYLNDKNKLMLLDNLAARLYVSKYPYKEKKAYIRELLVDFPDYRYSKYLKLIIDNKISLTNTRAIMLFLINYERKRHKLVPLKLDRTLSRISYRHLAYILNNSPKDLHKQEKGKKSFFGETLMERAKAYKYANKLTEWVVKGNDPIRHFVDAAFYRKLLRSFLNPNARHFYLSNKISKGGVNVLVSLIGIAKIEAGDKNEDLEDLEEELEEKIDSITSKYKKQAKNEEPKELQKLFWE